MKKKSIFYILAILLFSCQYKQESKKMDDALGPLQVTAENSTDSLQNIIQALKFYNSTLIQQLNKIRTTKNPNPNPYYDKYGLTFKDEEPTQDIKILRIGEFSHDDINEGAENLDWYGLFEKENKFILKKIKLFIKPTLWGPDGEEGFEGIMSGKSITSGEATEPIILIAGLENIKEGEIESVKLEKQFLKPGEHMDLSFNNYRIIFSAYGAFEPPWGPYYQGGLKDYLLEMRAEWNRPPPKYVETEKQLFAGKRYWCGGMYSFYWAGDIDRDGLLDLILDLYDFDCGDVNITLFLSSKAANGQLIKKVAIFQNDVYIH